MKKVFMYIKKEISIRGYIREIHGRDIWKLKYCPEWKKNEMILTIKKCPLMQSVCDSNQGPSDLEASTLLTTPRSPDTNECVKWTLILQ